MEYLLVSIFFGFITGAIGRYIAKEKNRSTVEGFWFGFLLSLLGVLIIALLPNKERDYYIPNTNDSEGVSSNQNEFSKEGKVFFYFILLIAIGLMVFGVINSK